MTQSQKCGEARIGFRACTSAIEGNLVHGQVGPSFVETKQELSLNEPGPRSRRAHISHARILWGSILHTSHCRKIYDAPPKRSKEPWETRKRGGKCPVRAWSRSGKCSSLAAGWTRFKGKAKRKRLVEQGFGTNSKKKQWPKGSNPLTTNPNHCEIIENLFNEDAR